MALSSTLIGAQAQLERKIIIEDNQFYGIEYDELYEKSYWVQGSLEQSFTHNSRMMLPWTRNNNFPLNQMLWDIYKDTLIAVNLMNHSLNDRRENIKKATVQDLANLRKEYADDNMYIYQGIEQFTFINNVAHADVIAEHKYWDTYFTDMTLDNQNNIWMMTHVEGQWRLYKNYEKWSLIHPFTDTLKSQPQLLFCQGQLWVLVNNDLYKIDRRDDNSAQLILVKKLNIDVRQHVFIIDKNNQSIHALHMSLLSTEKPLKTLLQQSETILK